jgi:hypothetical protein
MELEGSKDFRAGRPQISLSLDADIESFIIRYRIALNDLAFILRRLYPPIVRGMSGPKGPVHPEDREISIRSLEKFFKGNPEFHPELAEAFERNKPWLYRLQEQRDRLVHYKANVFVIEQMDGKLEFAILSPGKGPVEIKPDGSLRKFTTPLVFQFVHEQLCFALAFSERRSGLGNKWIRGAESNHSRSSVRYLRLLSLWSRAIQT